MSMIGGYSDIDLRIIVKDEFFEEYRANKKQRAKNWGNVLFYEDDPLANYSVAHFSSFIKVDSFYYQTEEMQPSIWLQNIRITHDTDGMMTNILEQSMQLLYTPTTEDIEISRSKFFAYVHDTYRRVMREEMYYALQCVDTLHFLVAAAWLMEAGIQPNTLGGWAKMEGSRSNLQNWQLTLLANWDCSKDSVKILHVLHCIIVEYKKVHNNLCREYHIAENQLVKRYPSIKE
ncbi:hypothetical protein O0555_01310 [Brevibacillus laterosporus]|uniref:hypothetical protein n=2 Tax=Brevibacillus laterosporus TaxID=1465 RepID=UPI00215BF1D8|nr:hypothetical protein [Brevibacillus laterosporus]MCR8935997.1 hypothetical protein [Brevibacillus laterosporus]MCZ0838636.1 hypothetical protein [Brevibacillus laterosporus]MCZ0843205.1 hypothetical protein [Brevibacillus laterosporus]